MKEFETQELVPYQLLKWFKEFDNLTFKPTYRNVVEKMWEIKSK